LETKFADVVIPDETVDKKTTIKLGGTVLNLVHVGRNHSDNSLVVHPPEEKIVCVVDFIPLQGLQFRDMPDTASPAELENSIRQVLAVDWDRMVSGHPGPGGRQIDTGKDAEDRLAYLADLSAEVKKAVGANKCPDAQ
jgi:glyoxylase-like metal-dependent hydrolase (beta-lactamase superfamily II)